MVEFSRPLLRGRVGAVACGHPLATSAALRVFGDGGNAIDAALAAAGVLSVVLPESCGLGGDAFILIRDRDGHSFAYNGSGASPMQWKATNDAGGGATTTVPGAVAAWEEAHRRLGRRSWEELLVDAKRLASDGFPATEGFVDGLNRHSELLSRYGQDWDVTSRNVRPGEIIRQDALARVLERIVREGSSAFYLGEIPAAISRAAAKDGGSLSADDLAVHVTPQPAPVSVECLGASIIPQPPVSQAILAPIALRALEGTGVTVVEDRTHAAIEAVKAAFAYRDVVAAPDGIDRLLSAKLEIDMDQAESRGWSPETSHTTAIVTADSTGTVVSMLISVFAAYGSGRYVPEGGFFLNNRLTGFSSASGSNAARPGERPVHTLSPIVIEDHKASRVMALSTPGGDGQFQTLVQICNAVLFDRTDPGDALARRRWRCLGEKLLLETGFDAAIASDLERRGHLIEWVPAGDSLFGAAVLAGFDEQNESVFAISDPRREAWAGVI